MQGRAQGAHYIRFFRHDDGHAQMLFDQGAHASVMGYSPGKQYRLRHSHPGAAWPALGCGYTQAEIAVAAVGVREGQSCTGAIH
jgi:hypothetical protein